MMLLLLAVSVSVYAQTSTQEREATPPKVLDNSMDMDPISYLSWVEKTGRTLHTYYIGYESARDTLLALFGRTAVSPIFGVVPDGDGWVFGFGAYSNYQSFSMKHRIRTDRAGNVREIETFADSLKAIGEMSFTAQAVKHALSFLTTTGLPKPYDDTNYRIAVLPAVNGNYLVYISRAQRDPEQMYFGMEYEVNFERVTGQVMSYRMLHKKHSPTKRRGPAGGMPYVRDLDIMYPTAVDVALVMELDHDTTIATMGGTYFIRRDGSVERLENDHPLANPTIKMGRQ